MAKKMGLDILAQELGQESLSFYIRIKEYGFDYDTPSSMISIEDAEKIKKSFLSTEDSAKPKKKTVVIRRRKPKPVEPPKEEVVPEKVAEAKEEPIEVTLEATKADTVEKTPEKATAEVATINALKGKKPASDGLIEIPELEATEAKDSPKSHPKKGKKKDKGKEAKGKEVANPKNAKKKQKKQDIIYEERYLPKKDKGFRGFGRGRKRKSHQKAKFKQTVLTTPKAIKRVIKIEDTIACGELAHRMGVKSGEVIKKLFNLGIMATINQAVDTETAAIIANDFGYEIEQVALTVEDVTQTDVDRPDQLIHRPPVVTIMGHVDHGKTSLLDTIRATNVTDGEAGGITQHIGAYEVAIDNKHITFLDTPGHEAFTSMRARGAEITDIVILVVAADDGVMPQTVEAINHSKAAGVPIIVAVNKIDKPDANPQKVKQELMNYELVSEEWGGDTIFVEVSAKQKTGISQLLEMILLQAEVMELKANPDKHARCIVIESKLDKGLGPVATVLVKEGTLRVGDPFITGPIFGKVRALINDRGRRVKLSGPSVPVEVLGLPDTPEAGDEFFVITDEKKAKIIIAQRQKVLREKELASSSKVTLEELYQKIKDEDIQDLNIILKADVHGSAQAVKESILKLSLEEIKINIMHESVGGITESDVMLAAASNAIIIGFNVRPEPKAATIASREQVDVRLYTVIYEVVSDIKKAVGGLLSPVEKEVILGHAEVRETFNVPKIGRIAGTFITDGKITRGGRMRVLRDNVIIFDSTVSSLKRFKDDAKEVVSGYECGIGVDNFNDIKNGDVLESYLIEHIEREFPEDH